MTRPTFKEVPSETATGQVVCDVRGSSDELDAWGVSRRCYVGWRFVCESLSDETDLQGSAV